MADLLTYNRTCTELDRLSRQGPVSGWVDRLGAIVHAAHLAHLGPDTSAINWSRAPVYIMHEIADTVGRSHDAGRFLEFLQARA